MITEISNHQLEISEQRPPSHEPLNNADALRDFLQHRDEFCPRCRFNLRNAISSRCPECGCALRLGVGEPTPPLGLIALMITAIAAPLGVIIPLWADMIRQAYIKIRELPIYPGTNFNRYDWMALGVASIAVLACFAFIALIVRSRRWLWTRSAWQRCMIAALAIALGATIHFGFLHELRVFGDKAATLEYQW